MSSPKEPVIYREPNPVNTLLRDRYRKVQSLHGESSAAQVLEDELFWLLNDWGVSYVEAALTRAKAQYELHERMSR